MPMWLNALDATLLPVGSRWLVRKAGHEIALFHLPGGYCAVDDSCPHAGASLAFGKLEGTMLTCRAHGLRFDLATGCALGSHGLRTRTYPVRIREGRVQIDVAPLAENAGEPD